MRKPRRKVVPPQKQEQICAILSIGGTMSMASRFTGCHVASIRAELRYNAEFAQHVQQAEVQSEIGLLKSIHAAASDQQWRAAAWALERLFPDRYAKRTPRTLTLDSVTELIQQLAQIIIAEVPAKQYRERLQNRIQELVEALPELTKPKKRAKKAKR